MNNRYFINKYEFRKNPLPQVGAVYILEFKKGVYIGATKNIQRRMHSHESEIIKQVNAGKMEGLYQKLKVQDVVKGYTAKIYAFADDPEILRQLEQRLLEKCSKEGRLLNVTSFSNFRINEEKKKRPPRVGVIQRRRETSPNGKTPEQLEYCRNLLTKKR